MYDIIELKSKSFDELLAIAEKLEISKPKSYSQDDLVYKILDEQAIKASEHPVEKVKKRGRPRVNKAPATIFLTTTVFPLVPGPNLYYMMYWIVGRNYTAAMQEAITLILTCLGIVFGFLIIEILSKYSPLILGKLKKSQ